MITGIRLPIRWAAVGFPAAFGAGAVILANGSPAWSWDGAVPELGIPTFRVPSAPTEVGWGVDHIVVLVPAVDVSALDIERAGYPVRRRGEVRGSRAAFFRAGPVLEVVEAEVQEPEIYGVALWVDADLDRLAERWRNSGLDVTDPHPAIQPDRRILAVRGLGAGLAVMTPPRVA
jgi:hypothetical protein